MVADFLCRKTLLSSALSQVRAQISTHSDGNFGLARQTFVTDASLPGSPLIPFRPPELSSISRRTESSPTLARSTLASDRNSDTAPIRHLRSRGHGGRSRRPRPNRSWTSSTSSRSRNCPCRNSYSRGQRGGAPVDANQARRLATGARRTSGPFSLPKRGELILEASHRVAIQEGPPTHAGHAGFGQLSERRCLRQAYDVHRAVDFRGEAVQRVRLP